MAYGINKIIEIVDTLFAGTSLHQMRADTLTLLQEIVEEADDSEVPDMIKEICDSIATVLSAEGKEIDPESCYDLLLHAVQQERAKIKARMMMMNMFRKRRRGRSLEY